MATSAEVLHNWAAQRRDSQASGNVSFNGPTAHSYGYYPIARLLLDGAGDPSAVLHRRDTYSSSTARHCNLARIATNHLPSWTVDDVEAQSVSAHAANVRGMLARLERTIVTATRARTNAEWQKSRAEDEYTAIVSYRERFVVWTERGRRVFTAAERRRIEGPAIPAAELERIDARIERHDGRAEERQASARELMSLKRPEVARRIRSWLAGDESVSCPRLPMQFIRVKGDAVETSCDARVTRASATDLCRAIAAGDPVCGFNVDGFRVRGWDEARRVLTVGCHRISRGMIRRVSRELGVTA